VTQLTLGVLTKADNVKDQERFRQWGAIIAGENRQHSLFHGYFVTMAGFPSSITKWEEKILKEKKFFVENKLWKTVPEPLKQRLGSLQLRKKLSLELSRVIQQRYLQC
jgi:hypothetical protein